MPDLRLGRSGAAVTASTAVAPESDRARLGRRAQLLAAATVGYNLVEAVVAVSAGRVAGSSALVGFGLDSVVEVSSGLIILWQFRHKMPESREAQALRLMAFAFFALAAYVTVDAVRTLAGSGRPDTSIVGVVLAALSLAVMPFLSWAQRRTGRALGSGSVVADSKQTLLCTYLSAVLLAGLLLNAGFGWWWADPVVGLVIAAVAAREGVQAWRGESCGCSPVPGASDEDADPATCGCSPGCTDACCQPQTTVTNAPAGGGTA
ncbi:cation transporter [Flexivirga oryzae]|uniref:Divalent metal cation (Fe/Co/Zn/Cd) transporter n=1 Tax=Flexivirga oryzae TaxID=1794944 RepID=A0A839N2T9_9MICO|nr:divalent metal cation (Fe/Co/Zn/Cd) transporter [Flexivirga oryzae]